MTASQLSAMRKPFNFSSLESLASSQDESLGALLENMATRDLYPFSRSDRVEMMISTKVLHLFISLNMTQTFSIKSYYKC